MASREDLHNLLLTITKNVYYQAPTNMQMSYPAILYTRKRLNTLIANNSTYQLFKSYDVTVIDSDPDSEIVDKVALLPRCSHDRHYVSDGLNHDVFVINY